MVKMTHCGKNDTQGDKSMKKLLIIAFILLSFIVAADVQAASTTVLGDVVSPITCMTTSFTTTQTGTIVPALAGKMIKVYSYKIVTSATVSLAWGDGASINIEAPSPVAANTPMIESSAPPFPLFMTTAGNALYLVQVGTGTVTGRVSYWTNDSQ